MTSSDGRQLVAEQSLRNAVVAGLIAIIVFCILWVMLTGILNRVLPWLTVALGVGVGFAVRRAGRGVDWRFPLVAATLALLGALLANVVLAAANTGETIGIGTLRVLSAVTSMTWDVYFSEVFNIAHAVFSACAAGLAAFLANRKLTRDEYYALRLWLDRENGD